MPSCGYKKDGVSQLALGPTYGKSVVRHAT